MKILFLLFALPCFCSATTLYVNASAQAGGDGTASRPFRTIQQAADCVNPGDTVLIAPGVYFETVRLKRFGKPGAPVIFRADRIQKNRVIVTGADPAIRRGERKWRLFDQTTGTWCIDHPVRPGRILYSGTDLFPYCSLNALMTFEARPGVPGPRHGFYHRNGKLFVRLRPDGKYGPADPNRHTIAVSPRVMPQGDGEKPDSRSYNFGLLGNAGQDLNVEINGLTFETPGRTAIYVSGNGVIIRNCLFSGCLAGGVVGRTPDGPQLKNASADITVEFCEWHSFPIFDDIKELITEVRSGTLKANPPDGNFHWTRYWVHKSRKEGAAHSYETGIIRQAGRNWTVRNCYIHDCFDAVANLNYGENTIFEGNLYARCVDNAIETENHARNCHIRRNRFLDVYQSISLQPLDGPPWPGPVYVYQNLFARTPENRIWGGGGGSFKIGIQARQWEFPKLKKTLKNIDRRHLSLPGLLIFNNTIIDPTTRLFVDLGGDTQKLDNVLFCNNLVIAAGIRHPKAVRKGDGGVFHYRCFNNRVVWMNPQAPAVLQDQMRKQPDSLLPGWDRNSFLPMDFEPAVKVPGAPEQFPYIGALQSPGQRIAEQVGVQEENAD